MIEVRELSASVDLAEAVRLQKEIWGFQDFELLPVRLFVVATKVGGQVLGAYDGSKMIGFCLSIPGLKPAGVSYLHSHMMGVLAEYRNRGVGRLLKLRQREDALTRGIRLIEWTFDPLELKNAFFNIERLGAVVRRYVLNQYGTTSSHLHGGLPTDRAVAEWHVASRRVESTIEQRQVPLSRVEARIEVDAGIAEIRQTDPKRARAIQSVVSEQFLACFNRGLTVIGFEKSPAAGTYLLGEWALD
ncbi:MAG: GNAT family N-acetyltransferase [Bryobacteraceae bacterium]